MEISPIAGVRVLPLMKIQRPESEVSAIFDIENSSKAGDDTYSGSGRKAAGGQDEDDLDDDFEAESAAHPREYGPAAKINFYA